MSTESAPQTPKNHFEVQNAMMQGLVGALALGAAAEKRAEKLDEQLVETTEQAYQDSLTKLPNRRAFEEAYSNLQKRNRRYRRTDTGVAAHSIMILDLDHFKEINDEEGHARGDQALREVANVMRQRVRDTDLPARFGGDEFAILLPRTRGEDAFNVAEDIRNQLDERDDQLTVSIGIVSITNGELAQSLGENLVRADIALYRAKEQRNHIVRYTEVAE